MAADTIAALYRGAKTAALLALLTPPASAHLKAMRLWLIALCLGMYLTCLSLLSAVAKAAGMVKTWR